MSTLAALPGSERCWTVIGVTGDHSCPELVEHVHCRNCPVFSTAGRALLERPAPPGYRAEWTAQLADELTHAERHAYSVLVFRIGEEWLAVDTSLVVEIAEARPIHRIAHRTGQLLAGLVNLRGQLQLCIALERVLRIDVGAARTGPVGRSSRRLVTIRRDGPAWAFAADEVQGVHRFSAAQLGKLPSTSTGLGGFAAGIFTTAERRIGYLDGAALFTALRQRIG